MTDTSTSQPCALEDQDPARAILNGYVRVIQKARSNSLEATDNDRDLAEVIDPVLFSEDTDKLLEALARCADGNPSPGDAMNFSWMMRKLAGSSAGVKVSAACLIDDRYNFIARPLDAYKAVAEACKLVAL